MSYALVCLLLLLVISVTVPTFSFSSPNDAYPTGYGDEPGTCFVNGGAGAGAGAHSEPLKQKKNHHYEVGEILDITHKYTINTPSGPDESLGKFLTLLKSMKNESDYNYSELRLPVHVGTHVDAPGHMFDDYYDAGFDVDTLDLRVLNGPCLLVDVPRDTNITAEAMASLNIPKGVTRVLFRTLNTDRGLMYENKMDTSYVGFMEDGAQWLVDNTDIKLIGIDYMSVAAFDHLILAHLVLLKSREIILVEALKLDDIQPGIYTVHCLPLRLVGAEGSPIRCILVN